MMRWLPVVGLVLASVSAGVGVLHAAHGDFVAGFAWALGWALVAMYQWDAIWGRR